MLSYNVATGLLRQTIKLILLALSNSKNTKKHQAEGVAFYCTSKMLYALFTMWIVKSLKIVKETSKIKILSFLFVLRYFYALNNYAVDEILND